MFATVILWWFHLRNPELFANAFLHGKMSFVSLAFVFAPPVVLVLGFASAIFFRPDAGAHIREPMTGYLHQQESERNWKIMVASGVGGQSTFCLCSCHR
jgi:hypothetical protein